MRSFLLSILFFLSLFNFAQAQDFTYGNFSHDELDMKSYKNDTSAHAVVLNEFGESYITTNRMIDLVHTYHVKIKIFDTQGFKNGTIEIPIYTGDSEATDDVEDVEGITYSRAANGSLTKSELNPKQVFTTKDNKYWSTVKFTMPNLTSGCVIEYKYRLTMHGRIHNYREWEFQSDIPKIYSEYKAHIPAIYNYNILMRGGLKLLDDKEYKAKVDKDCFSANGMKCDCSVFRFALKDIPAFIEEDNMTARKNFLSAIYFELSDYTDLSTGAHKKISKEWKDVDNEMKHSEYFGNEIRRRSLFKETIIPVIAGKTDTLSKAKAVYTYIQKNIKWNNLVGTGTDGLRKALEKHSGTSADINMSLAAALNSAGVNADVVLISTREHGIVNKLYPGTSDFNYTIVKTDIGGKTYFLDATDPLLSFGMLPLRCLNDQGRVMCLDKPSYWVDIVQQAKASTYSLNFTLDASGKLKGTITSYSLGYNAYLKRKQIKRFNSIEEYVEDLDEKQPKLKILKSEVLNVDSLDKPVVENYEVEIDAYDNLNAARLSFNPFMLDKLTVNPFKLEDRSYPVDLGMASSDKFTLIVKLPENYTVEEAPKIINLGLPDKGGRFVTNFEASNNQFIFSHAVILSKAIYTADEYPYLKELYNQIVKSEKVDMVFKKN